MPATNEEIETAFYQNAADRSTWNLYTNDAVWMRRLEALGIPADKEHYGGAKSYTLRADQVVVRKGKKAMSDEQKAQLAARMRELRSAHSTT